VRIFFDYIFEELSSKWMPHQVRHDKVAIAALGGMT
jgi:hypothetical protein